MSAAATGGGIGGSGDDDMEIWKNLAKIVDLSSSDEDDDDDDDHDHEPIRRGLAKHYSGKSRSFCNFKELEGLTMKELGKKRRRSKNQGQHDVVEDDKVEKMKKKKKN